MTVMSSVIMNVVVAVGMVGFSFALVGFGFALVSFGFGVVGFGFGGVDFAFGLVGFELVGFDFELAGFGFEFVGFTCCGLAVLGLKAILDAIFCCMCSWFSLHNAGVEEARKRETV